jgi:hypothetical protein
LLGLQTKFIVLCRRHCLPAWLLNILRAKLHPNEAQVEIHF